MAKNTLPLEKRYRPSNGTEGCDFEDSFCGQCIREKWMHTQNHDDMKCDILNHALLFDIKDDEYPEEWIRDEKTGWGKCTAYVFWDWGRDDDDDGLNEPPVIEPVDPNQLALPFLSEEFEDIMLSEEVVSIPMD